MVRLRVLEGEKLLYGGIRTLYLGIGESQKVSRRGAKKAKTQRFASLRQTLRLRVKRI
jgi:hypothetical protein